MFEALFITKVSRCKEVVKPMASGSDIPYISMYSGHLGFGGDDWKNRYSMNMDRVILKKCPFYAFWFTYNKGRCVYTL